MENSSAGNGSICLGALLLLDAAATIQKKESQPENGAA
jgi:hypothetical protein